MKIPPLHLVVMQPPGYVHSLGLLDQMRYFRYQFMRLGASVSVAKNRLRDGAVNLVFGAHLGFPAELERRHACIFVNLEQLGAGGAPINDAYLALLRCSAVVDYDAGNVAVHASDPHDVPMVEFLYAPYLADPAPLAWHERPIDLLFIGGINERRAALFGQIESAGVAVTVFDAPLYGEERDHYIRQSKAVLNCHFYDSGCFEQIRASLALSMGVPLVSERGEHSRVPAVFNEVVTWVEPTGWARFFGETFRSPAFRSKAQAQADAFRALDPLEQYAELLAFASGYFQAWDPTREHAPWQPRALNLGSGKDYKPGWLNIDVSDRAEPDLVLDLARPMVLPIEVDGRLGGRVRLAPGMLERAYANNVLEHVADLPTLMTNLLALLKEGGELQVEVPYERAATAWQDPTHVRAMNENSWLYYTDWFWYLGWFEYRFEIRHSQWLDAQLQPCSQAQAAFMQVVLAKVPTSARERTTARTMSARPMLPDDVVAPLVHPDGAAAGPVLDRVRHPLLAVDAPAR